MLALLLFAAAPLFAYFWHAPRLGGYFRMVAVIPLLYAVYSVFVGSANGLRLYRTQATFDVTFSIMKTILLVSLAYIWSVTGAFVGFVAAAAAILVIASRMMRLPATGEPFPIRRIASFMGAVVVYTALLNLALNSDLLLLRKFALSAPGVDETMAATVAGNYEALRMFAHPSLSGAARRHVRDLPARVARDVRRRSRGDARVRSQTMRYALILAGLMGIALAARPSALFGALYKPELRAGAPALPILATGQCCLALLSVACRS